MLSRYSLAKKDNDLAVLAGVIEELQQRETLSNVTKNAVTQRLQSVELELQDVKKVHENQLHQITTEMQQKLRSVQHKLQDRHSAEKKVLETLLAQEKSDRESDMSTYKIREEQMLEQMQTAVKEAKTRVYEKAQAQFAAGNKEYTKLKTQYKDMVSSKDAQGAVLAKAQEEIVCLQEKITSLQRSVMDKEKTIIEVSQGCLELSELTIKHFASDKGTDLMTKSETEKMELAKACVGLQHRQFKELTADRDSVAKKLRDSELEVTS